MTHLHHLPHIFYINTSLHRSFRARGFKVKKMRTSCNGCRVLRKGCTDDCIIRPCIEWIKTAESQGNATLFLAKFYGRAGLINLINAGPDNLRPAIFKSLLYEACGRIVDKVNGAIGLACTGNWHLCQAAVESVLNGTPITLMHQPNGASSSHLINPLNASSYDIRHVARELNLSASIDFHNVRTRARSRRTRSTHACGSLSVQEESLFSGQTVEPETLPETLNRVFNSGNSIGDPELGLELSLGLPYVVNAEGPVGNCSAQMDD